MVFIRCCLAFAWGIFRYPFHTTYVDLSSGKAVHIRE